VRRARNNKQGKKKSRETKNYKAKIKGREKERRRICSGGKEDEATKYHANRNFAYVLNHILREGLV
jgi:hypothetical protein